MFRNRYRQTARSCRSHLLMAVPQALARVVSEGLLLRVDERIERLGAGCIRDNCRGVVERGSNPARECKVLPPVRPSIRFSDDVTFVTAAALGIVFMREKPAIFDGVPATDGAMPSMSFSATGPGYE